MARGFFILIQLSLRTRYTSKFRQHDTPHMKWTDGREHIIKYIRIISVTVYCFVEEKSSHLAWSQWAYTRRRRRSRVWTTFDRSLTEYRRRSPPHQPGRGWRWLSKPAITSIAVLKWVQYSNSLLLLVCTIIISLALNWSESSQLQETAGEECIIKGQDSGKVSASTNKRLEENCPTAGEVKRTDRK